MGDDDTQVLARVKRALGVESLPALAAVLGEILGAVKSWSARRAVPLHALVRTAELSGRSLDWLVFCRPPNAADPREQVAAEPPAAYAAEGSSAQPVDAGRLRRAIDLAQDVGRLLRHDLSGDELAALTALLYRRTR